MTAARSGRVGWPATLQKCTRIRGFVFDGEGVSNTNLSPLSFGIFARFANDVVVEENRFESTVRRVLGPVRAQPTL